MSNLPPFNPDIAPEIAMRVEAGLSQIVSEEIAALTDMQARPAEGVTIARFQKIDAMIAEALEWSRGVELQKPSRELKEKGDALFRDIVMQDA